MVFQRTVWLDYRLGIFSYEACRGFGTVFLKNIQADISKASERYDAFIRMPLKLCPTFGSIFKLQLSCRKLIIDVFVEENMPVLS